MARAGKGRQDDQESVALSKAARWPLGVVGTGFEGRIRKAFAADGIIPRQSKSTEYEVELVQPGGRCSVFHMSMGVFEHIGRGVVVYVFLFVLLRFVGKKHVGQLAPFDLLVLLILSETVQNSLIGDDTSLVGGLISAATLVGLSYGMSMLTSSSKLAERLLEGTPKILVRHGRRRADEMKRQHITLAELTEALRHQGCANITQVRAAILENDGKITVIGS